MGDSGLNVFFENFLKKESLFLEKKVLQNSFIPEKLPHREEQINQLAHILAPALKQERPSNVFIYGMTGTGKTVTVRYTTQELHKVATGRNIPLEIIYINCKINRTADTEYRLIAELSISLGRMVPPTGLPTKEIYTHFKAALANKGKNIIIILDEIDHLLTKAGDNTLYNLLRINDENLSNHVSIIGISNDLNLIEAIDPRVKSSLSQEEMIFPTYNALQLQDILRQRIESSFKGGAVEPGVTEKCAALAAREHGDARRALDLLRVSGELAERANAGTISIPFLDEADDKIDRDRFTELVSTQPTQQQLALYTILSIQPRSHSIFTGEVYTLYKSYCSKAGLRPLTQRRISDILGEFDMLGFINAKIISKGRYGRMREISLSLPPSLIPRIKQQLAEQLHL
ncbi:TPA: AAA family ATPase [Candidatus Woesearchaeota archaeon]|nr:AAA family ATPase [Candidatus Woesearchaeota archaeon]HIJ18262.1 AAA family ATPase [Candidatus Woesearchaeota archaeon]